MYCVTGELPAAQGCRPTDDLDRPCAAARARRAGAASATTPRRPRSTKRRRDVARCARVMSIPPVTCGQATVARYASSRIRLQMCCVNAWNSGSARVSSPRGRGSGTSMTALRRPGCARHHRDAVGQEHRLVDRVRDEDDGAPLGRGTVLAPDAQELVLQDQARLRVERGERLVHQQHLGLVGHQSRERDALAHAARELMRILLLGACEADEIDVVTHALRCARRSSCPSPAGP